MAARPRPWSRKSRVIPNHARCLHAKVQTFIELIATQIHAGSAAERRRNAVAIYGMMVGTLQLARAVNDKKLSDEILESGVTAALALAESK